MQKHIYKILILLAVFAGALFFMSKNIKEEKVTLEKAVAMESANFPLLYLECDGYTINRLHGYSSSIDANIIREAMTPVNQNKEVYVRFQENETVIKKIKYELRVLDGNELLDSGEISALGIIDGGKTAKIKLGVNLNTSTEYAMRISAVTDESRKINYYTRIKYYETDYFLNEKLAFIENFHKKSLNKKKAEDLAMYLEINQSMDNTNFAKVNIHSSFDMFSWGDLKPELLTEVVPTIKEFNVETAAVQLEYFVRIKNDSGTEDYNVKEFYRVRYTKERIYLLDYERTMESLFDIKLTSLAKSEFKIGVTQEDDLDIVTSAENGKVSFARNGELWYYNLPENKMIRVFSFRSDNNDYFREDYDQHNIRILNMDDGGNIDFVVCGYMNSGDYEGKTALILYHFSAETVRIEEMVYIPLDTTYQMLKEDINDFSYVSQKGIFYFTINNMVYSYNIAAKKLKVLVEEIDENRFAAMKNSNGIAWTETRDEENYLIIMNLETEKTQEIKASKGEGFRVFGDIQKNVIYGYVKESDITETTDGTVIVPAYRIEIADVEGNILKSYEQKKAYVVDSEVNENIVKLYRVKKSANGYKEIKYDSLMCQGIEKSDIISIDTRVTDLMLTEKYLSLPDGFAMDKLPEVVMTVNAILSEDTTLHLPEEKNYVEKYYVYAKGCIIDALSNPTEAILLADHEMGTVINQDYRLIWERSGKFNRKTIGQLKETKAADGVNSIGACLYMVLQHNQVSADAKELSFLDKSIYNVLKENVKNPLNLVGCTLDEVLYFVSGGNLVIAMKDDKNAVLITGYDEYNVTYFDPQSGNVKTTIAKASSMFETSGNIFISYIN